RRRAGARGVRRAAGARGPRGGGAPEGGAAEMIRVRAASRLHFGLFAPPPGPGPAGGWPNSLGQEVLPARRFGGVGLMVQAPGLELTAAAAASWTAEGPLAERALVFAQQFARTLPEA